MQRFNYEICADSKRGANRKDVGTKQVVRCIRRSGVKRAEAKAKSDRMHATACAKIDRSTAQRDRRRATRNKS